MIPARYVEELKTAPIQDVDFMASFSEVSLRQSHLRQEVPLTNSTKMFVGKYTTVGSRSTLHPRVAKRNLTRHLGKAYSFHGLRLLICSM